MSAFVAHVKAVDPVLPSLAYPGILSTFTTASQ